MKGELNKRQKDAIKRHSKHHTKAQLKRMEDMIKSGKTFGEAHKKVGKKKKK